jgi:MoaA/NifB/PqqE/SkfB family radical SAM enzyme
MSIDRRSLYRFPWSRTDNPGAWVEVTDECDLTCQGCYRHRLEGHRSLEDVKKDILEGHRITRCDSMAIAGGEPLVYPHIREVVQFMTQCGIKPVILTNGEKLTWDLARDLKRAGLAKFHFHVDSGQDRPEWKGKNESEINALRQHFADLVWEVGGIQCGYNVTIYRSTLKYLPDIVRWCRANIQKVQHVSLIAFRSIPLGNEIEFWVDGKKLDEESLQLKALNPEEINITIEEMFGILEGHFTDFHACAYLNGTTTPGSYKYLITAQVGSRKKIYGVLGAKTLEAVQAFYHFFNNRYCAFVRNPVAGKKIFVLSIIDRELRQTLRQYLKAVMRNPAHLFNPIYIQSIHLQQPSEILNSQINLCDGCANMMHYKGSLINSCQLDEYRMFGGEIVPVKRKKGVVRACR